MPRRFAWVGSLLLGLALCAGPALGLIRKPTALKLILATPGHVFTARVEKMDAKAKPPRLVIKVQESLKKGDKPPFEQMHLHLTEGNPQAKEAKHRLEVLKRLAVDLPLVIFARKTDDKAKAYSAFVYTNGTWSRWYALTLLSCRSSGTLLAGIAGVLSPCRLVSILPPPLLAYRQHQERNPNGQEQWPAQPKCVEICPRRTADRSPRDR